MTQLRRRWAARWRGAAEAWLPTPVYKDRIIARVQVVDFYGNTLADVTIRCEPGFVSSTPCSVGLDARKPGKLAISIRTETF